MHGLDRWTSQSKNSVPIYDPRRYYFCWERQHAQSYMRVIIIYREGRRVALNRNWLSWHPYVIATRLLSLCMPTQLMSFSHLYILDRKCEETFFSVVAVFVQHETGRTRTRSRTVVPTYRGKRNNSHSLLFPHSYFVLEGTPCMWSCTCATSLMLYKNNNKRKKAVRNKRTQYTWLDITGSIWNKAKLS